MTDFTRLSRRERQIMDLVFALQGATVQQLCAGLPNPPTPMAVRRMLAILVEKGCLRRSKDGRQFVYLPRMSKQRAGLQALGHVLATFFEGSLGGAVATYLQNPGGQLTDEDVARLAKLIEDRTQK